MEFGGNNNSTLHNGASEATSAANGCSLITSALFLAFFLCAPGSSGEDFLREVLIIVCDV
jgi:hypothetical protein